MSVSIRKNQSRLRHATLVEVGGVEFWDRPRIPDIEQSSDDIFHTVSEGESLRIIAYEYYKDSELWWVIAHANNIRLLPSELYPGKKIIIPDVKKIRKGILI